MLVVSTLILAGVPSTAGTANCSAARMNTRSPPARIAGSTSGSVTRSVVRNTPAPAESEASSSAGFIERSAPADQQEHHRRLVERLDEDDGRQRIGVESGPPPPKKRHAWLMRPVCGLASRIQASAPTSGVEMKGMTEASSTSRRPGMSVRTTAQARNVPATTAITDVPALMMMVLRIAS